MNYELRCEMMEKKHSENPAGLRGMDKGFSDEVAVSFWQRVKVGAADDCWMWQSYVGDDGYGHGCVPQNKMRSHKVAWCLAHDLSAVPAGKRLLMTCNNRACCNPAHIAVGRIKFIDGKREKIIIEPAMPIAPENILLEMPKRKPFWPETPEQRLHRHIHGGKPRSMWDNKPVEILIQERKSA